MKKHLILFASVCIPLISATAQWPNAEHLVYIRIESKPEQATLTTVPTKEGEAPIVLGKTPMVVPVEINWDTKYLRKRWELIHVSTRHGIATNTYDAQDKSHTITFTFAIEKEDHQRQIVQEVAAVLPFEEKADGWDELLKTLPQRRTLSYNLLPLSSGQPTPNTKSAETSAKKTIPTVIVARGATADASKLGYAIVEKPAGAIVIANGIHAGTAPLRLMLPAGENRIGTTEKDGKPAPAKTITIEAGITIPVSLDTP